MNTRFTSFRKGTKCAGHKPGVHGPTRSFEVGRIGVQHPALDS